MLYFFNCFGFYKKGWSCLRIAYDLDLFVNKSLSSYLNKLGLKLRFKVDFRELFLFEIGDF